MNRNFERALKLVLAHEGGWADHPKDPGGATMKGVTLATFRQFVKPGATKDDLRKITDAQLAQVYRRHYWDVVKADQLPDGLDYAVFDYAVNSGPGRAAKHLQAVLGVAQDGIIGPATLAAANAPTADVIKALCARRMTFLRGLKTWSTFGKGWERRVTGVRAEALAMAAAPPAPIPTPKPHPAPPVATADPVASKPTGLAALIEAILKIFRRKA